jgi:hypothetical protein
MAAYVDVPQSNRWAKSQCGYYGAAGPGINQTFTCGLALPGPQSASLDANGLAAITGTDDIWARAAQKKPAKPQ